MFETYVMPFVHSLWHMSLELAPWLLVGLIVAGLIKVFVPLSWVAKLLGRPGFKSTLWASLLGAPLPLCSCSVLPVAIGIRRQGASRSATSAFLVSTPENGVDAMAVTYALLGPFMTIIRPIAAILNALAVGIAVGIATRNDPDTSPETLTSETTRKVSSQTSAALTEIKSCCATQEACEITQVAQPDQPANPADHCEQSNHAQHEHHMHHHESDESFDAPLGKRLAQGMWYGVTTLFGDLLKWLIIGLVIAAVVEAYLLPTGFLETWGQGPLAMLVMLLIGIPMYICATSSTPLAAALLAAGVSPGAVLVLLLAGPATNVSTFGVLRQELGMKAAVVAMITLGLASVLLGVFTDLIVNIMKLNIQAQTAHHHDMLPLLITLPALIVLVILAVFVQVRNATGKK